MKTEVIHKITYAVPKYLYLFVYIMIILITQSSWKNKFGKTVLIILQAPINKNNASAITMAFLCKPKNFARKHIFQVDIATCNLQTGKQSH